MAPFNLSEPIRDLKIPALPDDGMLKKYIAPPEHQLSEGERYLGEKTVRKKAHQISCIFLRTWEGWGHTLPAQENELLSYYASCRVVYYSHRQRDVENEVRVVSKVIKNSLDSLVKLLEEFPFCGEIYRAMAYILLKIGATGFALDCMQHTFDCYKKTYPDLDPNQSEFSLSWEDENHFYFLHHLATAATVLGVAGIYDSSLVTFQAALNCTFGDTARLRYNMLYLMFKNRRFEDAETLATIDFDMEDDAVFLHGMLLRDYIEFKSDNTKINQLQKSLFRALQSTSCVTIMLLLNGESSTQATEPALIAHNLQDIWNSIGGVNEWVKSVMFKDGPKPPSGRAMFSLLRRGDAVIFTQGFREEFIATSDVALIPDAESPSFRVPEGTKAYQGSKLVMFKKKMFHLHMEKGERGWIHFKYNDIQKVPFWSLILACGPVPRCCQNMTCGAREAAFDCARCGAVSFCSRECQKEDWKRKDGHRKDCKRWAKK